MSTEDISRIREVVSVNAFHAHKESEILEMLAVARPIIFDGHFELLSEKHSDMFFRFAKISQFPSYVSVISREMYDWLKSSGLDSAKVDVVLGPTSQGMLFAYNIAGELSKRVAYATINKANGKINQELAEGFEINRGERVLIVNDVVTTGEGVETLVNLVLAKGGVVAGICLFANRGNDAPRVQAFRERYLFHSIIDLVMPAWDKKDCELCKSNKPLIKSSEIHGMPIYSKENEFELYLKKMKDRAA